jgi:hypothetical protein
MDHEDPNPETNGPLNGAEPDQGHEQLEIEELRRRIEALQVDADKRLRELVRERPLLMLGAALAAGFIVGRAIRRA